MLIIRGVNLFHTQIEELIQDIRQLAPHYQLIVSRTGTMDTLSVVVEADAHYLNSTHSEKENLAGYLQRKIKNNIGISAKVTVIDHGQIPRSEGGKLNRIVDKRK